MCDTRENSFTMYTSYVATVVLITNREKSQIFWGGSSHATNTRRFFSCWVHCVIVWRFLVVSTAAFPLKPEEEISRDSVVTSR